MLFEHDDRKPYEFIWFLRSPHLFCLRCFSVSRMDPGCGGCTRVYGLAGAPLKGQRVRQQSSGMENDIKATRLVEAATKELS